MIEVRFHGRGGQGAVVGCNILACALLKEGKYAQSFPLFGGERRGAPVQAFLRISDTAVMARGQVYQPDHIVVLSPGLIAGEKPSSGDSVPMPGRGTTGRKTVLLGLKKGGWIIINSHHDPESFNLTDFRVATVDATGIATKHDLGSAQSRPVNTAILGAFAKATGLVSIEALIEAVTEEVPAQREKNIAATQEAYTSTKMTLEEKNGSN